MGPLPYEDRGIHLSWGRSFRRKSGTFPQKKLTLWLDLQILLWELERLDWILSPKREQRFHLSIMISSSFIMNEATDNKESGTISHDSLRHPHSWAQWGSNVTVENNHWAGTESLSAACKPSFLRSQRWLDGFCCQCKAQSLKGKN